MAEAAGRPSTRNTIVENVTPVQNMTAQSLLPRDIHRITEDTDSTIEWLPGLWLLKNGMHCCNADMPFVQRTKLLTVERRTAAKFAKNTKLSEWIRSSKVAHLTLV